jgi:hypothetical protein
VKEQQQQRDGEIECHAGSCKSSVLRALSAPWHGCCARVESGRERGRGRGRGREGEGARERERGRRRQKPVAQLQPSTQNSFKKLKTTENQRTVDSEQRVSAWSNVADVLLRKRA